MAKLCEHWYINLTILSKHPWIYQNRWHAYKPFSKDVCVYMPHIHILRWWSWFFFNLGKPMCKTCVNECLKQKKFSSVAQSCPTLQPHGLQQARPPCPSPTTGVYSNSCPLSRWCHPTISSSVLPFSSCLQSFPASGSFQMSQFFASGGQSIGVSASASLLPMNIQDWFPLGWTGWMSLQSQGLSRVFSNTTVQDHQFFGAQLSL